MRIYIAVADNYIAAAVNITTIIVTGTVIINVQSLQAQPCAFHIVLHPEAGVTQTQTFYSNVLTFTKPDVPGH